MVPKPLFLDRKVDLHVLHVDALLVAVDKPAGLPSVPGRSAALQDCVVTRLKATWADVQVVHRLDIATSGVLVLARGADAQRLLSHAFATRRVGKTYVADVSGVVADDTGTIDLPLLADWVNRPRQKVDLVKGKPAQTLFRVLARNHTRGQTRLLLEPRTGRSHQLRVHLQAIGHPIVGDALYGLGAHAAGDPANTTMRLHAQTLSLPDLTHMMSAMGPQSWSNCRKAADMSALLDAYPQRLTLHTEAPQWTP